MDISEELLQKAIDSILHGSTQIVTRTDSSGVVQTEEIRINDLRQPLIEKLADKLIQTDAFKKALENIFSRETTQAIVDKILNTMKFEDLPWQIRDTLNNKINANGVDLKVRKYTLVAEVVEDNKLN